MVKFNGFFFGKIIESDMIFVCLVNMSTRSVNKMFIEITIQNF